MTKRSLVIGAHAHFYPEAVGTSTRLIKPAADGAGWVDLGIGDWGVENTSTTEDIMAPAPGARQLYDEVTTSVGVSYDSALKELSNICFALIFGDSSLPTSGVGGQYNPGASGPAIKGWLKIEQYGQDNVLLNTVDSWVSLKITGKVTGDEKVVNVPVLARQMFSTLNTGTLA